MANLNTGNLMDGFSGSEDENKNENLNSGSENDGGEGKEKSAEVNEHGFPVNTSPKDMQPEHRANYWIWRSRENEKALKEYEGVTPEQIKEFKAEADRKAKEIEDAKPEQEKLISSAREEGLKAGRDEMQKKYAATLVSTKFEALSTGRATAEQLTALLEDLNISNYLTDSGEVDAERIKKRVDTLFPNKAEPNREEENKEEEEQENIQGKRPMGNVRNSLSSGGDLYDEMYGPKK